MAVTCVTFFLPMNNLGAVVFATTVFLRCVTAFLNARRSFFWRYLKSLPKIVFLRDGSMPIYLSVLIASITAVRMIMSSTPFACSSVVKLLALFLIAPVLGRGEVPFGTRTTGGLVR